MASKGLWEGIGGALSRHAERMDMDRREQQKFQRDKDFYKYKIEEDEALKRRAMAAGGSRYIENQWERAGHAADRGVDYGFEQQGENARTVREHDAWREVRNPDGSLNTTESGSKAIEREYGRGDIQAEYAARFATRRGGPGVKAPKGLQSDRSKTKTKTKPKPKPEPNPSTPETPVGDPVAYEGPPVIAPPPDPFVNHGQAKPADVSQERFYDPRTPPPEAAPMFPDYRYPVR